MKLSKSLLKAVAVGLAIGGVATSCTTIAEEQEEITLEQCETTERDTAEIIHTFDCPACGMG